MEFGPRALGSRSILADPRDATMQRKLNLKVKFRESFRPFAPVVLESDYQEWFQSEIGSPYMTFVDRIREEKLVARVNKDSDKSPLSRINDIRSEIPAVTHVNNTARVQTLREQQNERLFKLIKAFKKLTGCPILINTSFNVRGEPIVCTPEDAFRCFMGTEIDILVIGNSFLEKNSQNESLITNYRNSFLAD